MDINVKDFKDLYVKTAEEYLKVLDDNLQDRTKAEELHRSAHSLKGQSLAIGYQAVGKLSLVLEKFFRKVMEEDLELSDEQVAILRESVAQLRESLEKIKAEDKEPDVSAYADEVQNKLGMNIENI